MATILVVDDELGIRALLSEILSDEGHTIELAENATQARAVRERMRPDLVLLDIWMPDVDGVTLLKEWGSAGLLTMPVIMMSGHGTIDTAVEATKFGAIAFLEKPITLQKLLRAVEQALVKTAPPRPAPTAPGLPSYARPEPGGMAVSPGHGLALSNHMPSGNALASEQSFELDRPLREARDAFEKSYFHDPRRRKDGPGAHPPLPQAQAAGRGPQPQQARWGSLS
jgi:DNA-binding response OmpR family regulator